MPVSFEWNRIRFSSALNEAPPMPVVPTKWSIVYCLGARGPEGATRQADSRGSRRIGAGTRQEGMRIFWMPPRRVKAMRATRPADSALGLGVRVEKHRGDRLRGSGGGEVAIDLPGDGCPVVEEHQ